MSYRFKPGRNLAKNVNTVATQRVDQAIAHLRDPDNREAGIHAARKNFKKTRSLLRLLRSALDGAYQQDNDCLRKLGHRLGPLREADAMAACLERLTQHQPTLRQAADYQRIYDVLTATQQNHEEDHDQAWFEQQLVEPLQRVRQHIGAWSARLKQQDEGRLLETGLKRYYGRGRSAFHAVLKNPDADTVVHAWRKRAKDLWHHHRLLVRAWPGPLACIAEELDDLCDLLGDHHDLSDLAACLQKLSLDEPERWQRSIRQEQNKLLQHAIPMGQRIWQEKPKRFAKRLTAYWLLARQATV